VGIRASFPKRDDDTPLYLAIYFSGIQKIKILKFDDKVEEQFENNPKESEINFHMELDISKIYEFEHMRFDINNRFIIVQGKEQLLIQSLENPSDVSITYQLDLDTYEIIYDISFESKSDGTTICVLACKLKDQNQIRVFQMDE